MSLAETTPLLPGNSNNEDEDSPTKLSSSERFWFEHRDWLEQQGYALRDRYQPGWQPSWLNNDGKHWFKCEDAVTHVHGNLMDATRTSDGHFVMLKRLVLHESQAEVEIIQRFSSQPHLSNPSNHSLPVLETLQVPGTTDVVLLVMPLLLYHRFPEIWTCGEALEFVQQLFEGLKYMHSQSVVHGDIKSDNVVMDGYGLFNRPPHPVKFTRPRDFHGTLTRSTRTEHPVRYYFIDFGLSRQFPVGADPPMVLPWGGGDNSLPEFKTPDVLCDPYKTDVYRIANIVRMELIEGHEELSYFKPKQGLEFLKPLIEDMVHDNPAKRPTMSQAVERLTNIRKRLWWWQLRSRLRDTSENPFESLAYDLWHWLWTFKRILFRTPAIPTPHEAPWWL
ncbi:kinase-like domain-containing protein [Flagelloscypha sp. PMI_526]|nr:kinase-like domain-containing protein [Flagelloscypha sp. PMI_526]